MSEAEVKLAKIKDLLSTLENDLREVKALLRGDRKNV